jgi:hypothetical protein
MPTDLLRPLRTYEAAVKALGGTAKAARALKTTPQTICQWRTRHGAFPADQYFKVQGVLAREGFEALRDVFTFEPR